MRRSNVKPPTDEEILAYDNVLPEIAARYVGMSTPTIYAGLQQGRVPFGFAVENEKTHTWSYNISPGGLVRYKHEGNPIIRLGDLREVLTDYVKEYTDTKLSGLNKVLSMVLET